MAADFIKIDRTNTAATHSSKIIAAVQTARSLVNQLTEIQGIGFRNFAGTDFAAFEALFGIPAGKGQTVFDLINGSQQALAGTAQNANALEFINRVG